MRKKLALFLAAALALPGAMPARSVQADDAVSPAAQANAAGTGQVDVSVTGALLLKKPVNFAVSLTGAGTVYTDSVTLNTGGGQDVRASFEGLVAGTYTLRLKADGFAGYTQEIAVGGQGCEVRLATGFLGGMNYSAGAAHPGVLLIGDVDGDGTVGDADRELLVDAIDRGQYSGVLDLNGDGAVDLVDLEYFSMGYQPAGDTAASLEAFIPVSVIAPGQGDNTTVDGDLSGLLKNTSSVALTPKYGGDISGDNPVSLEFDVSAAEQTALADGIIIETAASNPIRSAVISVAYTDETGAEHSEDIPVNNGISYLLKNSDVRTEWDSQGNILLYLGSQVAVKKVTLTITGMQKNSSLAEISKVEFVNGMENRIPEPEMDIPENLSATAGSETISLTWSPCVNVTGYEVRIRQGGLEETMLVAGNSAQITKFGGKDLKNYTEYELSVQSVNGTWRSGYSSAVSATPKPNGRPDRPDNVSAVGNYQSITVSWKQMKDTVSYDLYYKERSASQYNKIADITNNRYTITGLRDLTEYTVYVIGVNEFGASAPSLTASAKTTDLNAPVIPRYGLINSGEAGQKGAHILSATRRSVCPMTNSPLDTQTTSAWGTVDRNPESYYQTAGWDEGGFNAMGSGVGLTYEFDSAYKLDTIAIYCHPGYDFFYARVRYWDANETQRDVSGVSRQTRQDADGRSYLVLKLAQPITAKKLQLGFGRYLADGVSMRIAEIYFYHYDTMLDEIMALYQDDLHTVLKSDVTQATIDRLRVKIHEVDEVSGEYNPNLDALERELKTAEDILNNVSLNAPIEIHSGITMNDAGRGFGGLNAWQPLGITAAAGEKITIYVGHDSKRTGDSTNLRLVATQYHSESSPMSTAVTSLKVGANIVEIPRIGSLADQENGGALYIEYTGNNSADRYAVRVSGGVAIPRLDLYGVTDAGERLARASAYLKELEDYVGVMETNHQRFHANSSLTLVNGLDYNAQNCILGASDILLDKMLLSLPASQILSGAGSGTLQERAQKLLDSMKAMDDMMHLFYQHKGLNANAEAAVDQLPKGHLNIRYQRMFSGAFMYAAGNHIGIEWGSASGLISASPVVSDSEGKYVSGRYFGWGIAHEIGHNINQGAYAVAEITNNYFAVLAQAHDTNGSVRFSYNNVYKKVTSGTKGKASNVFTQLGMYWQLHLAYDTGYNYRTWDNYSEQLANLFFARVDTYARTPSRAPMAADGGVALTLSGGTDQVLMRLSCAAAEKNILEFFERWGMTPDEGTRAYAEQFEKETRAIYYVSDDSRVYSLQGGKSSLGTAGLVDAVSDDTSASINANEANRIDFVLGSKEIPAEDILGYEITRCMIAGGETTKEPVGFTTGNTFSDTIASVNNRVVWYEVAVIDKYLNRSAAKVLEPLKIEHDGSLDKAFWTVGTKNLTVAGETENTSASTDVIYDSDTENAEETALEREKLIDGNTATVYTATAGADAEITLEFGKELTVTGFKYTAGASAPSGSYEIQLLSGDTWTTAAKGSFGTETTAVIAFANEDQKYVSTFRASALRLILSGMSGSTVSIAELDVLGVTGDNVDFRRTDDGTAAIGRLTADYQYGENADDVIPEGSIIFTGAYKGSPAYNVVVLYDQDGNIVGGADADGILRSHQIILADVPAEGNIANTSDGVWIYWLEPDDPNALAGITKVRAELYRVNNALTNEGQRLVSDSLFESVPEELPGITISGN
ncbi:MAG: fibronectin type III domain-containing protein [Lachnospiraceae bacterium]|nr:fibronectin type III domain-containing protein [Lachnospiraceae bacterium]